MSALRTALFDWDAARVSRVLVAGLALYLAQRIADGFLAELGAVIVVCVVLDLLWVIAKRIADR
ncbi:uncharacterized protein HHUB_4080 (plasmid) [Halobacterium hubeiense]|uniref:Uncharacterized protein n=1 Tax=Halobacterium hubeiense TaxID=1407499 RepID=A0A0U5H7C8_9EURY|nr:hypothetical protein [Halobacterium hubeiense]CQH63434.1 uncharacterized protein HHUB_4080 [Halobacterium hubeiense]